MVKPLVTIVTVTYNLIKNERKKQFIQSLESVQNQTYKNIEHIVIDGASNDGTVEMIKEYADKGWVKYISEPDNGLYDAMNKGAIMAQGKYLIFLNSDDFFSGNEGIEKSVKALEKANADYSYTKAIILDPGGNRIILHPHSQINFSQIFVDMPFCHQTLMVKTDIFKQVGMFDLQYKSAGDYDFVLRLFFNKHKQVYVPYEFVTFRRGGYSLENEDLSIREVSSFYQRYYNRLCKLSFEECKNIYTSKKVPLRLLIKSIPYFDYENKIKIYKRIVNELRKKFFRICLSKNAPSLVILGIKIV